MINFYFILFLFICSTMYVVNSVLIMYTEGILGGDCARPHQITYQVAIVHKANETGELNFSCNGGIISKNLVLTIAQCFLNRYNLLQNYEYSIIADTIIWKGTGITTLVDQIFLPGGGNYFFNDIAIASLLSDLDVDNNPYLSKLEIPQPDESFYKQSGRVSGYGFSYVISEVHGASSSVQHTSSHSGPSNFLRYAEVVISVYTKCAIEYPGIDLSTQFCGIMLNIYDYQAWGLCKFDEGSPLVINNTVVGLGSKIRHDCDDTIHGSTYTKVSAFAHFINSFINNDPLPDAIVLNSTRYSRRATAAPAA